MTDDKGNFEISPEETIIGEDPRYEWDELESSSYTLAVYYHDRDAGFGQSILTAADQAAEKMEDKFSAKLSIPIKVVIYNNPDEVLNFIDSFTENTGGQAIPDLGVTFQVVEDSYGMQKWIDIASFRMRSPSCISTRRPGNTRPTYTILLRTG